MFDTLSERLNGILDRLTRRGALSEADVEAALREVRRALLEADVALDVARAFTDQVKTRAVGVEVVKSVTPGQMVVKIVHDQLIETLGSDAQPIDLNAPAPVAIMMVGLQGSGKTTTTAKIAKRLTELQKRKVLMASLDTRRPAAMEQLAVLGTQVNVETLPIVAGQSPVQIAARAEQAARLGGYDVLLLDTAGRTTLDEGMMSEAAEIARIAQPAETLLVADSLTGQDAVRTAKAFHERLPLTGLVLTRADGDSRGGAALSMRAVTGLPIKFLGTGERIDALDVFDARRVAGRILGQGDVVALVEKATAELDHVKAEQMARKLAKGKFDLEDLSDQLAQMERMGGMEGVLGLLPGVQKIKKQMAETGISDKQVKRQRAIIGSMTKVERKKPDMLQASRKRRIAAGAGVEVAEVNRLLKQHRQMQDAFKFMAKDGGKNMARMAQMMGGGGMDRLKTMGGGRMPEPQQSLPPGLGGAPSTPSGGLPGLPGFGAAPKPTLPGPILPGLGGGSFNPFKKP